MIRSLFVVYGFVVQVQAGRIAAFLHLFKP